MSTVIRELPGGGQAGSWAGSSTAMSLHWWWTVPIQGLHRRSPGWPGGVLPDGDVAFDLRLEEWLRISRESNEEIAFQEGTAQAVVPSVRRCRVFRETTSCSRSLSHTVVRVGDDDAETSRLEGHSVDGIYVCQALSQSHTNSWNLALSRRGPFEHNLHSRAPAGWGWGCPLCDLFPSVASSLSCLFLLFLLLGSTSQILISGTAPGQPTPSTCLVSTTYRYLISCHVFVCSLFVPFTEYKPQEDRDLSYSIHLCLLMPGTVSGT